MGSPCSGWRRKIRRFVCIRRSPARRSFSGMGELHLEIIVDRMKREFGVEANIGRPQVTYRETIRKTVKEVEGKSLSVSPAVKGSMVTWC